MTKTIEIEVNDITHDAVMEAMRHAGWHFCGYTGGNAPEKSEPAAGGLGEHPGVQRRSD